MVDFRFVEYPVVAHVGAMDVTARNSGSYEGRCLSVSLAPMTWASIARLGEDGFILSGRGRFVDVHALGDGDRKAIKEWGRENGLLEAAEIARLHYLDTENDEWRYTDCVSAESAALEAEEFEEGDFRIETVHVDIGTARLASLAGHKEGRIDADTAFDMVLVEYASRDEAIDGLWWDDEMDPDRLSAPRGGIFPSRLQSFAVEAADLAALEAFEDSMDMGYGLRAEPKPRL